MVFILNSAGAPSLESFVQLSLAPRYQPPKGTIISPSLNVNVGVGQAVSFWDPASLTMAQSRIIHGLPRRQSQLQRTRKSRKRNLFNRRPIYRVPDRDGQRRCYRPQPTCGQHYGIYSVFVISFTDYTDHQSGRKYHVYGHRSAGDRITGTIKFSASGLPSGSTATFNPTTVNTSGSTTMTVITGSSSPTGSYPITITGTSGSINETSNVTLGVGVVATPAISPGTGTYLNSVSVSITDPTSGASIYYTTDGSTPTVTPSELYTVLFTLSASATVNAIAAASGFSNSTESPPPTRFSRPRQL